LAGTTVLLGKLMSTFVTQSVLHRVYPDFGTIIGASACFLTSALG
jgi:hypothetical protein